MYGRTALQEVLLEGRRLTNRHYRRRSAQEQIAYRDWTLTKHRPKTLTWATGTHARSTKVHAIRYVLRATHKDGHEVWKVAWQCGGQSSSKPIPQSHPTLVCAGCAARLSGQREVVLSGDLTSGSFGLALRSRVESQPSPASGSDRTPGWPARTDLAAGPRTMPPAEAGQGGDVAR